jgi:LAO/AO transport system kinase
MEEAAKGGMAAEPAMSKLAALVRAGDRGALSRALTLLESDEKAADALLAALAAPSATPTDRGLRIGFTGPPGAGKSTLIEKVALRYRSRGHRIGILAVDPTSLFTGGALLGDRIRMGGLGGDPEVFLRSMATRGHRGGLSAAAIEAADLMAAAGFDRLLIETVGVGQSELEVAGAVQLVVVVLVPEAGDAVQSLKAGLTEIGDLIVVNKADRPGAEGFAAEVREALALRTGVEPGRDGVEVLLTDACAGRGVDELVEAIEASAAGATERARARRAGALKARLLGLLADGAERRAEETLAGALDEEVEAIATGRTTPRRAAARLLARLLGEG